MDGTAVNMKHFTDFSVLFSFVCCQEDSGTGIYPGIGNTTPDNFFYLLMILIGKCYVVFIMGSSFHTISPSFPLHKNITAEM